MPLVGLDAPFLPLKQADMCLVCIAFASWVLKSASPGADTWKAGVYVFCSEFFRYSVIHL